MTVGFPQPLGRSLNVRSPQRARSPLRSGAQRVRSPLRPVNAAADATSPPPKPRTPPRPATPPPALFKSSPPKVSTPKVSTPLAVRMPNVAPIPPRTPSTPIDALRGIDVDDDACAADLLCEAVASHRKSVALSARRAAARPLQVVAAEGLHAEGLHAAGRAHAGVRAHPAAHAVDADRRAPRH